MDDYFLHRICAICLLDNKITFGTKYEFIDFTLKEDNTWKNDTWNKIIICNSHKRGLHDEPQVYYSARKRAILRRAVKLRYG